MPTQRENLFLLTNPWSYVKHGHASSELAQVHQLLEENGTRNCIVSVGRTLNKSNHPSLGYVAQKMKLDRSIIFKNWIENRLIKDLQENLKRQIIRNSDSHVRIVMTSSRFSHAIRFSKSWERTTNFSIRLIDSPLDDSVWQDFFHLYFEYNQEGRIAFEHKTSLERAMQYSNRVIHVPAAQGLMVEPKLANLKRDRVGLFFPVGRSFEQAKVYELISAIENLNPIVKIPNYIDKKQASNYFPKVEFLKSNLTDMQFRDILLQIKVAVLGHENYIRQSSGYVSYFVANNVPVLASQSNDFFGEFEGGTLFAKPEDKMDLNNLLTSLLAEKNSQDESEFAEYTRRQWKLFLNSGNGNQN